MRYLLMILMLVFSVGLKSQTLEEYLKEAENNNIELKAKYIEYEQSLLNAPQVAAMPNPTLDIGVFVTRPYTRLGPQNFKLSLAQKLPWFGTLSKYEQESLKLAEAKRLDYEAKKDEIFYKIRVKLIELHEVNEMKKYYVESLALSQYLRPIVKTKVEVNKANLTELLKLDLKISELETEIELLELDQIPIKQELRQLLNRDSIDSITSSEYININYDRAKYLEKLAGSPSILKLNQLQQAAKIRAEAADSESNPDIVVGLEYTNLSPLENIEIENNGMDIFMPRIGISIPFFNDSYSAKKEQSVAIAQQYEYEQADLRNKLISEYEGVDSRIASQSKRIELYKKQIEKSEQIKELIMEEYSSIMNQEIDEILEIEDSIVNYKLLMLEAETSSLKLKAQLLKIVGD
ncbi:MAG: TolC family protein [Chlorobiota bacterium]